MEKKFIIILGIMFIILGCVFGATIREKGFCLGDEVFTILNLPKWSNGKTGCHYPAIVGIVFAIIGVISVNSCLTNKNRIIVCASMAIVIILVYIL